MAEVYTLDRMKVVGAILNDRKINNKMKRELCGLMLLDIRAIIGEEHLKDLARCVRKITWAKEARYPIIAELFSIHYPLITQYLGVKNDDTGCLLIRKLRLPDMLTLICMDIFEGFDLLGTGRRQLQKISTLHQEPVVKLTGRIIKKMEAHGLLQAETRKAA